MNEYTVKVMMPTDGKLCLLSLNYASIKCCNIMNSIDKVIITKVAVSINNCSYFYSVIKLFRKTVVILVKNMNVLFR